jgi:hypothetical protein
MVQRCGYRWKRRLYKISSEARDPCPDIEDAGPDFFRESNADTLVSKWHPIQFLFIEGGIMVRQINYWAAGLACCLALLSHGSSPIKSSSQSQTQVVFLGTGTPLPDPDRAGPSTAIVVNGTAYIVDAGTGLVRRAAAAYGKGIPALRPNSLRIAFLTHLHSDHTLGLPDLMITP